MIEDNKRPDGTTLLSWARPEGNLWQVTVPDTYAESHINDRMTSPDLAADQAAQQKMDKYSKLLSTHIFCPVAVETAGTWNGLAIELVQEIERRITAITGDVRETVFLF